MINGHPPVISKQVFDINFGYGVIIAVEPDMSFTAKFGHDQVRYSRGGYKGKSRRVYWDNPIVVEPTPDSTVWKLFRSTARNLYDVLSKIKN